MNNSSNLTDLIMADRVKGLSYLEIERKHGITALDARELVREAISNTSIEDEWEMRGIAMLRIERVIEHLWTGVERGEFKHAEAMIKAIEQLSNLLALNKQVMEDQRAAITDEQAAIIYMVVTENNRQIFKFITDQLKPNKKQQAVLEEWPAVVAEASTAAIEATLHEEDED